jgi:hypothetical protein
LLSSRPGQFYPRVRALVVFFFPWLHSPYLGLGILHNLLPSVPLQRQPNWSLLEVQSGRISGGFPTFSFLQGRDVSSTPNHHPGGPGLCIYFLQREGGPVIPTRHLVPILVASYDTHGLWWDCSYSRVTTRGKSPCTH